ncbi:LacI family DNA-binding transcriptional regulator [Phycisphaerales bacterium AB-hyl4]|uniref:LacI family DNA-binding transcriptional regulator n=1 Tax=Natronomicrosphaera hydrolytica TaxID=3242702 RepID=A0ABV4UC70_9BACT
MRSMSSNTSVTEMLCDHLVIDVLAKDAVHRQIASQAETLFRMNKIPPEARFPTHRQLAQALGTHPMTISRAYAELASRGLVRQERGRGTFANRFSGRLGHVAVLLPPWAELVPHPHIVYVHQEFLAGVHQTLQSTLLGVQTVGLKYPMSNEQLEENVARIAASFDVVMCMIPELRPLLQRLAEEGVKVITYYWQMNDDRFSEVRFRRREAMHDATLHLIRQGRRRIGFWGRDTNDPLAEVGFLGYLDALEEAGLTYDPTLTIRCKHFLDLPPWQQAAQEIVRAGRIGDAVVADVNHAGHAALKKLQAHGYRVPDDVAVVGFDDPFTAPSLQPPMTWTYLPRYEMGQAAAEIAKSLVLEQIEKPIRRDVVGKLVLGQSCGASQTADGIRGAAQQEISMMQAAFV